MPAKITSAHTPITPMIHFPRRERDCPKCSGLRPLMPPEHKGLCSRQRGPTGVTPQDDEHDRGDDPGNVRVDEPERAPAKNVSATATSTARWGRMSVSRTPTVVAITTCTAKAAGAPTQTAKGRPRVATTREANMVLSGSSPGKITGKTAAATAGFTQALFCAGSRANLPAGMRARLHPGRGQAHD